VKKENGKMATVDFSEELDKILSKAFSDTKKRIITLQGRREKRLLKENKISMKNPAPRAKGEKTKKPVSESRKPKDFQRSRSTSDSQSE